MKKKTINQQIVKALAVGISASMALQPMAVYAEGEDVPVAVAAEPVVPAQPIAPATPIVVDDDSEPAEVEATEIVSQAAPTPEVVEAAKDAIDNANAAYDETSTATPGDIADAEADSQAVAKEIIQGTEEVDRVHHGEAGVEGVITPFGPIITKDYAADVKDEAKDVKKDQHLEKAEAKVSDAKDKVAGAVVSDAQENTQLQEASEAVSGMQDVAATATTEVTNAIERANELKEAVVNGNKAQATVAYNELDALAETTKTNLEGYNEEFKELNQKYDDAIEALKVAQAAFDNAINNKKDGALADVGKASNEVKQANKEVQDLKNAIDAAIGNIQKTNAEAVAIIKAQEAVEKENTTANQDALFEAYVRNVYADVMLDNPVYISSIKRNAEHGYMAINYINAFGRKATGYFNYTYEDGGIVFYEKDKKEIEALNYIDKKGLSEDAEIYYYEAFGVRHYVTAQDLGEHLVEVNEFGKTNHYIVGDGHTKTLITPVDAPEDLDDFAEGQDTKEAVKVENEKVSYRMDYKNHSIVKVTTADVTTTKYGKFTYEAAHRETEYTDEEKAAAVDDIDNAIYVSEIRDNSGTYYVVSGTYFPSFKIVLTNDMDYERRTYVGDKIFGNYDQKGAKEAAIKEFLYELGVGKGINVVEKDLSAAEVPSGVGSNGFEDFRITGTLVFTLDGVQKYTLTTEGENSTLDDAKEELSALIAQKIKDDEYYDSKVLRVWAEKGFFTVDYRVPIKATEIASLDGELTEEQIDYDSFCFDYVQKISEEIENNKTVSYTTYREFIKAYEVIQNANKDNAINSNKNKCLNAELDRVKNLLDKYMKYQEDTIKAQNDIKEAKEDLKKTADAIFALKDAHKNKKASEFLAGILGDYDIAGYFKLGDVTPEEKEKLDNMTVGQFLEFLEALKEEAQGKINGALADLEILDQLKVEAKEELDKKPNPPYNEPGEPDEEPDEPTYDGPSDDTTPATPFIVQATAAAPAPAAVLGETRPVRRNAVAKAAEEAPVEEAKPAPEVKAEQKAPEKKEEKKVEATIAEEDTAKAAAPVVEDKPFAWGWLLLILAALAGVSVEEYVRRKNAKAKANSGNDTAN